MKKKSLLLGIFLILILHSHALGLCPSDSHGEGRLLMKQRTYEDATNFSSDLKDANGNEVSNVPYKLKPRHLVELQFVCRRHRDWLGEGFTLTGAIPLKVQEPNADLDYSDSKVEFNDALINYYGVSWIFFDASAGAIPASNSNVGFLVTGKLGYEIITGVFNYHYDGSDKQTGDMKNFESTYLEFFGGLRIRFYDRNDKGYSLLIGTSKHLTFTSATVKDGLEIGISGIF